MGNWLAAASIQKGYGNTGTNVRVSVADDGTQGDLDAFSPAMSADGKHVAFIGRSINLVPGVTSGQEHVYVVTLP